MKEEQLTLIAAEDNKSGKITWYIPSIYHHSKLPAH
jgi:hypothetical protein